MRCFDANFVVTRGTGVCRHNNPRCREDSVGIMTILGFQRVSEKTAAYWDLGHLLLTWIIFNPSMDKWSHAQ